MASDNTRNDAAGAVGFSLPRVDGVDKVTGRAKYVDDLRFQGEQFGFTVRSKIPRGRLLELRQDPAFDFSRVTIVTADDIPGENTILLIDKDQPALVPMGGEIAHVGEAVALVCAPTMEMARAAADALEQVVEELPPVLTTTEATEVFKSFEIKKGGDIDAAFADADHIIEGTYETGAQEQMYIEPQGIIAKWDGDTVTLVGSLQCPYYVHKAMMPLLDLQPEQVIVEQAVTGGGFGGKEEYPSMVAGHAALLAKKAQCPVRLIYDRQEDLAFTTKRHPSKTVHRMGIKNDGTIVAIDVDVTLDGGAYSTLSQVVLSRAVLHSAGPYKCPTTRIRGRALKTNTPPHGAFRGFGAPQTTFAYERQTQKAAAFLGMDPFEFRLKNCLRIGDTTATEQELTNSVASDKVLNAVREAAGSLATKSDGKLRGRDIAFYYHGAGFTGSGEERLAGKATIVAKPDGRFEVLSSSTDIGQGAITTFTQIASDTLGVDPSLIDVVEPSTANVPDSGPTVASRTCMVVGAVVQTASRKLRERLVGNDASASPVMAAKEKGPVSETAVYSPPPGIKWDDDTYTGSAYPVYGWACCLVDVAVDPRTYEVEVERCIHAVDVGKAIHPIIVKGQIEGGTLQSIGWALWEGVRYRNGAVWNDTMTNCIVPTFADAPELETIIVEEPYPFGPHGAKGVGEIPMDGPCAAAVGAVSNAVGKPLDVIPVLPEVIYKTVRAPL